MWGPNEGLSWTDELSEEQDEAERRPVDWRISGEPWARKRRAAKRPRPQDAWLWDGHAEDESGTASSSAGNLWKKSKDYPEDDYYEYSDEHSTAEDSTPRRSQTHQGGPQLVQSLIKNMKGTCMDFNETQASKVNYPDKCSGCREALGRTAKVNQTILASAVEAKTTMRKLSPSEKRILDAKSNYNSKLLNKAKTINGGDSFGQDTNSVKFKAGENKSQVPESTPLKQETLGSKSLNGDTRSNMKSNQKNNKLLDEVSFDKHVKISKPSDSDSPSKVNSKASYSDKISGKLNKLDENAIKKYDAPQKTSMDNMIMNVDRIPVHFGDVANKTDEDSSAYRKQEESEENLKKEDTESAEMGRSHSGEVSLSKDTDKKLNGFPTNASDKAYWLGGLAVVLTTLLGTGGPESGLKIQEVREGMRDFCNVVRKEVDGGEDRMEAERRNLTAVQKNIMQKLALLANSLDISLLNRNIAKLMECNAMADNDSDSFDSELLNRLTDSRSAKSETLESRPTMGSFPEIFNMLADSKNAAHLSHPLPVVKSHLVNALTTANFYTSNQKNANHKPSKKSHRKAKKRKTGERASRKQKRDVDGRLQSRKNNARQNRWNPAVVLRMIPSGDLKSAIANFNNYTRALSRPGTTYEEHKRSANNRFMQEEPEYPKVGQTKKTEEKKEEENEGEENEEEEDHKNVEENDENEDDDLNPNQKEDEDRKEDDCLSLKTSNQSVGYFNFQMI